MAEPPQTKRCTACGEIKTAAEFGYQKGNRKSGLGLYSRCKRCSSQIRAKRDSERRRTDPSFRERVLASKKRSDKRSQATKAYRQEVQQRRKIKGTKEWAGAQVHRAVEKGRLAKPKACERCSSEPPRHQLHGHHWHGDYANRPLDVEWLCSLCHGAEHSRRGGMHGQPDTG
jgi:hypothetical protein